MWDPRSEAFDQLGGRYEVRVLEPSPPAVTEGPWFADDPVAAGEVPEGRLLVSPVAGSDLTWSELVAGDLSLAGWCADRWLAAYRRLEQAPPALVQTREALHRVAAQRISPARAEANGKIGLRYTRGGFGTPFFGEDRQLRVQGADLVTIERREETSRESLNVDPAAAAFIADWFGFAASVLEELRAGDDDTRVQLWPEHFDMAIELGSEQAGERAAYGLSPGDEVHDQPYVYVAPWTAPASGELWNATSFTGAELPYSALLEAADQRETALDFLRERRAALTRAAG
jgi:hypothetical protein